MFEEKEKEMKVCVEKKIQKERSQGWVLVVDWSLVPTPYFIQATFDTTSLAEFKIGSVCA